MKMRLMMMANRQIWFFLLATSATLLPISSAKEEKFGLENEMDYVQTDNTPFTSPSPEDYDNLNEDDVANSMLNNKMEENEINLSDTNPLVYGSNDSLLTTFEDEHFGNESRGGEDSKFRPIYPKLRDPLSVVIPVTCIYALILLIGLVGNVSTCVVIAKNNYMHTATNYYLFSLAISDLLLLISGLPQEMYLTWLKWPYVFGEAFCLIRGLAAETSANATVLTITAFTFERYVAICHPLRSHKLSQLSRVIRLVLLIWILALTLALPQAAQFGVIDEIQMDRVVVQGAWCTIKRIIIPYAFQISIIVFFLIPMTIITGLYVLIGLKLRRSRGPNRTNHELTVEPRNTNNRHSQSHVIRMLVILVVCFFICWSPFHIQRLMAIYSDYLGIASSHHLGTLYNVIEYTSGILYYVSTCINPILYHIMSHKFRQAFKDTMSQLFGHPSSRVQHRTYSSISHHRTSRMGVYHHHQHNLVQTHGNNHHFSGRRGAGIGTGDMETCINCRHTPSMCSCRGKSKGPVHQTSSTAKSQQSSRLMALLSGRSQGDNVNFRQVSRSVPATCSMTTEMSTSQTSPPSGQSVNLGIRGGGGVEKSKMMIILTKKKKKGWNPSESTMSTEVQMDLESGHGLMTKTALTGGIKGMTMSQTSVDSANTNTISNSSLQNLDEKEFTGEELAEILQELKESLESSN